ncbi:MAG: BON domain-containing protein [Candidatus Eisenbacteria bacterium]|nr:BON domain-containing protein [Candidatus Eisenbacteria bacterium]
MSPKALLASLFLAGLVAASVNPSGASTRTGEEPNDSWITLKTKAALLTSRGVDGMDIHVDALRGRVTLFGRVDTRAQRTRAGEIARGVSGVTLVRNLLQIATNPTAEAMVKRSDDEIRKQLEASLGADATLADSHIQVKGVSAGTVVLSGTATTLSDQLQAIRIARGTAGVHQVASDIKGPDSAGDLELWSHGSAPANPDTLSGTGISDNWITLKTKLRLMANDQTPAGEINVDTDDHVVTLFGVVPSEASRDAAGAEARQVGGVREVKNQLEVVAPSRKAQVDHGDDQLEASLGRSYKANGRLKGVDVQVKNGVVRLTGSVAHELDVLDATVLARGTAGVRSVRSELTVKAVS